LVGEYGDFQLGGEETPENFESHAQISTKPKQHFGGRGKKNGEVWKYCFRLGRRDGVKRCPKVRGKKAGPPESRFARGSTKQHSREGVTRRISRKWSGPLG